MSILKDLSQSLLKYGEIVVNKTEIITHSAKEKIDVRKKESEIESLKTEIGNHIFTKFRAGSSELSMDEDEISSRIKDIGRLTSEIEELQDRSDKEKKEAKKEDSNESESQGTQS